MEKAFVDVVALASVTLTVKLYEPLVAGLPESTPVEPFNINPDGKLPAEIDHEYGVLPPAAASV